MVNETHERTILPRCSRPPTQLCGLCGHMRFMIKEKGGVTAAVFIEFLSA